MCYFLNVITIIIYTNYYIYNIYIILLYFNTMLLHILHIYLKMNNFCLFGKFQECNQSDDNMSFYIVCLFLPNASYRNNRKFAFFVVLSLCLHSYMIIHFKARGYMYKPYFRLRSTVCLSVRPLVRQSVYPSVSPTVYLSVR